MLVRKLQTMINGGNITTGKIGSSKITQAMLGGGKETTGNAWWW